MFARGLKLQQLSARAIVNARTVRPVVSSMRLPVFSRQYSTIDKQLKQILKQENDEVKNIPNELDNIHKDYITNNKLQINTVEGNSNVELVKELSNGETLRVYFDIDEVTDIPIEEFQADENGEVEEIDFDESISNVDSLLCSIKVLVSKPNNEAVFMNLFLQSSESSFMIDFINYKPNSEEFLNSQVKNGEFLDKFKYQGPRFSELDESIQIGFENYLESVGINQDLADFIISYSETKEENEYRKWLNDLANFF